MKLSMQSYTVRDHLEKDLWGTLEGVCKMGLSYVEISGTSGVSATEYKKRLDDLGLSVAGNHVSLDQLENEFESIVEDNRILDNRYIILPWIGKDFYSQGWAEVAKRLEPYGARLRDAGLVFAYHNHAFEFAPENGKPGLDVLYETADPDLVKAQIDTYWVAYGGCDPAACIRKYSGRIPIVHLKDGTLGGAEPHFLEVGQGQLDWDDILAACQEAGVEYGAVEQDTCTRDSMESARMSVDFLRGKGLHE